MGCGGHSLADLLRGQPGLPGITGQPFAKKVVQRCMLGLRAPARAFDQIFISAEGYVPHTTSVHGTCALESNGTNLIITVKLVKSFREKCR